MIFSSLTTYNFRNLNDAKTKIDSKDVYLVGINGQGKTNFLEAIYFSNYGSSFRSFKDIDLIKTNEKECSVQMNFCDTSIDENVFIKIENGKKTIFVNGKKVESRKTLLSIISCIIFCHEDMEFVTGSPEKRRWFFDQNISLYDTLYLDDLQRYKRILKTRNALLKDIKAGNSSAILDVIDPQLVEFGIRLMERREEEIAYFSKIFEYIYKEVSGIEHINIRYKASWKIHTLNETIALLAANRERDVLFGTTLSGPHRDKYGFYCGENEFSENASTGQKRLYALLLRVAQASRYLQMTKKKPVLLLDDVLLELDGEKKIRFLATLPEYEQAFYTFLPEEPYQKYKADDAIVYHVKNGGLQE
ncbi:MAG: DNA replication and repair protein RecF [Termitinemataceae bacterium]|nr:MAG: DNA replication and repair protein RecF [Termitinemataceae bacterium]